MLSHLPHYVGHIRVLLGIDQLPTQLHTLLRLARGISLGIKNFSSLKRSTWKSAALHLHFEDKT